jgi:hypothetical protein
MASSNFFLLKMCQKNGIAKGVLFQVARSRINVYFWEIFHHLMIQKNPV